MSAQILAAAKEKGVELGGSVGSVPEVYGFAKPYWDAFRLLQGRRPYYIGATAAVPGAIPVSEIRATAPLFGFEDTDSEFVQVVDAMDNVWLSNAADQRASTPPPKPRGR